MILKGFFKRIADDFRQKELLPLKMLFFVHASTLFVLYPYLTIHMRELGISVEETAITAAVTPVVTIIMPPLAGILADRIGNFKVLLAIASSSGGAAALLLLLVPVGRYTVTYPDDAIFTVGCSGDGGLNMQWAHRLPCASVGSQSVESLMTLHSCGVVCSDADAALESPAYTVRVPPSDTFTFTRPSMGPHVNLEPVAPKVNPGKHFLHLDDHLGTGVRKLAGDKAFLPFPGLFDIKCDDENGTLGCSIGQIGDHRPEVLGLAPAQRLFVAKVSQLDAQGDEPTLFRVVGVGAPFELDLNNKSAYRRMPLVSTAETRNASCFAGPPSIETMAVSAGASKSLGTCEHRCLVTAPRKLFCSDSERLVELNPQLTFWSYLVVRMFVGIIGSTAFAMFEGAVIAILREHKADYGLQRIYASVGSMISSPLSGVMIDYASAGKGYTDFRPAFYLYSALKIISGVLMLTINLEFKAPAHNVIKDVMSALRNVEMVALFIVCLLLGTAWGYIESFLFWLLQDLGASRSLMGITITVGGIAGIPLLVMSGPIIQKLGHANVLFIGFIFYAVRLLGYSLIYNPWLCLIFEAMESLTSSLATTAAVTYAAALSTSSTDTSIQGLIGGLYHGVGRGSGSLIGGYLMKAVGTRATYRIFAAATFVAGVIYVLFNHFYFRRRTSTRRDITETYPDENEDVKKKEKDLEASKMEQAPQSKACWCPPPDTINSVLVKNGKNVEPKSSPIRVNDTIAGYGSVNTDNVELSSSLGQSLRRRQSSDRTSLSHSQEHVHGAGNPTFEDDEGKLTQ